MELVDVVGPWYPCNNCGGDPFYLHDINTLACSDPIRPHSTFDPMSLEEIFDLSKLSNTPLEDIASRLKAL